MDIVVVVRWRLLAGQLVVAQVVDAARLFAGFVEQLAILDAVGPRAPIARPRRDTCGR